MNINELFQLVHDADIENLIPLKDVQESDYICLSGTDDIIFSYDMIVDRFNKEIADKTYMLLGGLPTIVYFDKETYVMLDIMTAVLTNRTSKKFQEQIQYMSDLIQKEGLESPNVELHLPSQFKTSLLAYYMSKQEIKSYEDFIRFYIHSEYGFGKLPKDKIKQLLTNTDKKYGQDMIDSLPEEVIIYRGEGNKSTPINEALSWTLNKNIAYFFVNKSDETAYIYTATVKKEDILAYIDDRNEAEVLVLPESVSYISRNKLYSVDDVSNEFEVEWFEVLTEYQNLLEVYSNLLSENLLLMDNPEHGLSHMQRVCILGGLLYLVGEDRLDDNLDIIMTAGLLHDIGRIDNGIDAGHGIRSSDLFLDYQKKRNGSISDEDEKIATIITYHDVKDNEAINFIQHSNYEDKEDLLVCWKYLKDADALDRVRFGIKDLDVNYLRESISRDFVFFAHQLLKVKMDIEE